MTVHSPKVPLDHPERALARDEAMEARFVDLVESKGELMLLYHESIAAGWEQDEVSLGITNLLAGRSTIELRRIEDNEARNA
ncbi:hypothetical protein GF108_12565 [Phyllobacterium sp. SYP-B3895]|uniref:hypothetical protein n=1 Tax=Phyllobacterium sp. SYP-B3895 TaxID=2663240 RepID=UPI0012998CE6|nr:hypothetical protein [Phyllobacterium sp. SYP-B3895]MRG56410.1 hypothetical protein [Phyllobacterium sp. SYP-B3895]